MIEAETFVPRYRSGNDLLEETNEKSARVGHALKRRRERTIGSARQGEYKRRMIREGANVYEKCADEGDQGHISLGSDVTKWVNESVEFSARSARGG